MKEIVLIIRPEKLEEVKTILDNNQYGGLTISSVMGCGSQKGQMEHAINEIKGMKTVINLLPKIRVEVVVSDNHVEDLILELCEKLRTGHVGDGKLFIRDIEQTVRIRTGERGDRAL